MNNRFKHNQAPEEEQKVTRVRLPRNREVIGIIEQRLGGNKMMVACLDGKTRVCRVPGRLKRDLWLRPNDVVIIELWELDADKGDVIFKYRPAQIDWLKANGYLKQEKNEF
ncbi:MAG: translation initiation factor eIF-1A [Parcubacteria group bacterium]|jgi:translation initiation factor 1A